MRKSVLTTWLLIAAVALPLLALAPAVLAALRGG